MKTIINSGVQIVIKSNKTVSKEEIKAAVEEFIIQLSANKLWGDGYEIGVRKTKKGE